jgi:lipid-A-disaccharide synthase
LGSRPAEVARLAEPFGEAVGLLHATRPDLRIVIPVAATVADEVRGAVAHWPGAPLLIEDAASRADAMKAADLAWRAAAP